jgi:hypothetical protein
MADEGCVWQDRILWTFEDLDCTPGLISDIFMILIFRISWSLTPFQPTGKVVVLFFSMPMKVAVNDELTAIPAHHLPAPTNNQRGQYSLMANPLTNQPTEWPNEKALK